MDHSEKEAIDYVKRETGLQDPEEIVKELLDEKTVEVKYPGKISRKDFKNEAERMYRRNNQYPYSEVLEKLDLVQTYCSKPRQDFEKRINDPEEIRVLREKIEDFKVEKMVKNEDRRKELVKMLGEFLERNLE